MVRAAALFGYGLVMLKQREPAVSIGVNLSGSEPFAITKNEDLSLAQRRDVPYRKSPTAYSRDVGEHRSCSLLSHLSLFSHLHVNM
jgi:hypothetical protein